MSIGLGFIVSLCLFCFVFRLEVMIEQVRRGNALERRGANEETLPRDLGNDMDEMMK